MKKNKLIISSIAAFTAVLTISCNKDFLNKPFQRQLEDATFWTNANDAYLALNACYNQIDGGEGMIYDDGKTDNAYAQYPWESNATEISLGDVTPATGVDWDFTAIRRVNNFLDKVEPIAMDENLKKRFKAEARFLRAYRYANMMNNFGDVPLITYLPDLTNWAVPRNKREDIFKFVVDELTAVAEDLPASYANGKYNERGRVTKGAAYALLARVNLYESKWQAAADAAQKVMGMGYDLFTVTTESEADKLDNYAKWVDFTNADEEKRFRLGLRSYEQLFWEQNENNVEVILDRQYIKEKDPKYLNTYLLSDDLGGWSSVTPTQELINDYMSFKTGEPITAITPAERAIRFAARKTNPAFYAEYKNRDPRFYASILFEGNPWNAIDDAYEFVWVIGGNNCSKTGFNFRKMVDPVAYRAHLDNYSNQILIRYAEVLLTYAEAKNEAGGATPDASVYDALDKIRVRAGMAKVDRTKINTKEKMQAFIRQERRIELALEGHRYMDIRRWKTAPTVMHTIQDLQNGLVQTRAWDNKLYLMPVPQSEIDINPKLKPNNPGYIE
ncbi:putative outer membrane starch-binding protein [Chitinophaga skermanii]|uniref:Putative outer membrane starch-binding protein n=1 Tax=Chitinophaga skermanii TaxID=331697 RepID=A0A327QK40_9BACT|nr:RagB/SusD family nutrient uptake outer membrane protein [Chitinophaga skermanii]RAJ04052.1 putative outer membrane starch-binding protein [Chitinophaga skermanii]